MAHRIFQQISSNVTKTGIFRCKTVDGLTNRMRSPSPFNDTCNREFSNQPYRVRSLLNSPKVVEKERAGYHQREVNENEEYNQEEENVLDEVETQLTKEELEEQYINRYKEFLENDDYPSQSAKVFHEPVRIVPKKHSGLKLNYRMIDLMKKNISKSDTTLTVDVIDELAQKKYNRALMHLDKLAANSAYKYQLDRSVPKNVNPAEKFSKEKKSYIRDYTRSNLMLQPSHIYPFGTTEFKTTMEKNKRMKVVEGRRPLLPKKEKKRKIKSKKGTTKLMKSKSKMYHRNYNTMEQHREIEEIMEQYKKLEPQYTESPRLKLIAGSNEEKEFIQRTVDFVNENKTKIPTETLSKGELNKCNEILLQCGIASAKNTALRNPLVPGIYEHLETVEQKTNFMKDYRTQFAKEDNTDIEVNSTNLFNRIKSLHPEVQYETIGETNPQPVKMKMGSKLDLQQGSSFNKNLRSYVRDDKYEKLAVPWPSLSDKAKQYSLKQKRIINIPTTSGLDSKKVPFEPNKEVPEINKLDLSETNKLSRTSINTLCKVQSPGINFPQSRSYSTKSNHGILGPEATVMPKLYKLCKQKVREPIRKCFDPNAMCKETERADKGLKVEMKRLPTIKDAECPCKEDEPLEEGKSLTRLNMSFKFDREWVCPNEKDNCPPRADKNLKVKQKILPKIIPGECVVPTMELKDGPPLKRFNLYTPDPPKVCEVTCVGKECCPPRADDDKPMKKKSLLPFKPQNCPCIEDNTLIDGKPLSRLPPFCLPEPKRVCPKDIRTCTIPRADENLLMSKKKLKQLTPSNCPEINDKADMTTPNILRLKPFSIPEPKKECKKTKDDCPERCDGVIKIGSKKLPPIKSSECPPAVEVCLSDCEPLKRLTRRSIPDKIRNCDRLIYQCPARADEGLKVQMKKLRKIVPGDCQVPEEKLKPGPPLIRIKFKEVSETPKICKLKEDECPERADQNIEVTKKTLPLITGSDCNAKIDVQLNEGAPLRPLKKVHIPERKKICPEKCVNCCPQRSDDISNYSLKKKKLSTMILCEKHNDISANDYNTKSLKRDTSVTKLTNRKLNTDSKLLFSLNSNTAANHFKSKIRMFCSETPSPIIGQGTKKVYMRRVKYRPGYKEDVAQDVQWASERRCKKSKCGPEPPKRMDNLLGYDAGKKKLPKLVPSMCPCKEGDLDAGDIQLLPPKKRQHYGGDELKIRVCHIKDECNEMETRSDKITGYVVKKKKLPVIYKSCKRKYSTISRNLLMTKQDTEDFVNTFNNSVRFISTSDVLNKKSGKGKKKCPKMNDEKKKRCPKINLGNCPPMQRKSCKEFYIPKKVCAKQNSPYPSFSECKDEDALPPISECESNPKHLQPKWPILNDVLVLTPPPPKHAIIDPKREEECILKKLKIVNKGKTKNCENFHIPVKPIRAKDLLKEGSGGDTDTITQCPNVKLTTCGGKDCEKNDAQTGGNEKKADTCKKESKKVQCKEEPKKVKCDEKPKCKQEPKEVKCRKEPEEIKCKEETQEKVDCEEIIKKIACANAKKNVKCVEEKTEDKCDEKSEIPAGIAKAFAVCEPKLKEEPKRGKKAAGKSKRVSDDRQQCKNPSINLEQCTSADSKLARPTIKDNRKKSRKNSKEPSRSDIKVRRSSKSYVCSEEDVVKLKQTIKNAEVTHKSLWNSILSLFKINTNTTAPAELNQCKGSHSTVKLTSFGNCTKNNNEEDCRSSTRKSKGQASGCKQKPLAGCEPKARKSCDEKRKEPPPCTAVEPPFPSFSEKCTDFDVLKSNECKMQEIKSQENIITHDYSLPSDETTTKSSKGSISGKQTKDKKCYSTMCNQQVRSYSSRASKKPKHLLDYFNNIKENQNNNNIDEEELRNNILKAIEMGMETLENSRSVNLNDPYFELFKHIDNISKEELQAIQSDNEDVFYECLPWPSSGKRKAILEVEDSKHVNESIQNFCRSVCNVHDFPVLEYEESERKKTEDMKACLTKLLHLFD